MAITHIEYALLRRLKDENLLPEDASVLELGQSNWYGDVPVEDFIADIRRYGPNKAESERLVEQVVSVAETQARGWLFQMADLFWQTFLGPHSYEAIDLHGVDERAHKLDLNEPVPLKDQYDIVCNFGTAEHIFNVYQVFKTIHERTKPGGLMLHGLPFQGWVDHGFFTFQPTFFFDLAEANTYVPTVFMYAEVSPPRIVSIQGRDTLHDMAEKGEIGPNAMLFTALRKRSGDAAFKTPLQGYYAQRLNKASVDRWKSLR
jgi:SAM-dependent methyltransferase